MSEPRDLPSRIQDILEEQQVEVKYADEAPYEQVHPARILGIAETRDKIMKAAKEWRKTALLQHWTAACDSFVAEIEHKIEQASAPGDFGTRNGLRTAASIARSLRRHDAAPVREGVSAPFLWCCHIRGPDDVIACADYAAALKMSDELNAVSQRINAQWPESERVLYAAVPAPWPWSAEAHAADMRRQLEGK